MEGNKLVPIHILEMLNEYASAKKPMIQMDIMKLLEEKYNEKIFRHTCSDYLKALRDNGYIKGRRGIYKTDLLNERELRTLIDGVMYGKQPSST